MNIRANLHFALHPDNWRRPSPQGQPAQWQPRRVTSRSHQWLQFLMVPRFWQFETQMSTLHTFPPRGFCAYAADIPLTADAKSEQMKMNAEIRSMGPPLTFGG